MTQPDPDALRARLAQMIADWRSRADIHRRLSGADTVTSLYDGLADEVAAALDRAARAPDPTPEAAHAVSPQPEETEQ